MRLALLSLVIAVACVDPLTANSRNSPEWEVKNVKGYAETVAGPPPDVVFGWAFVVEGDVARWRECVAVDSCGFVERSRPKEEVLAIENAGKAGAGDAGPIDVVKLTLTPSRRYVVPYVNPVKSSQR